MSLRDDDRHRGGPDDGPEDFPDDGGDDRDDRDNRDAHDDDRDDRPRPRILALEAAKVLVRQYLDGAVARGKAPVDHEGRVPLDLCYHRADRPIRTFPFDPSDDLAEVASAVVDEAADVLADSGAAEGRYDVRIPGQGLRSFPLRVAPEPTAMARVVHDALVDDEGSQARALLREAREQLAGERERNDRLAELTIQTMGVVLDAKQAEFRTQAKREKQQAKREKQYQKTINKLVKQRFETLDDREELASKKHERDAEDREAERKARREDEILEKLMDVGPKILALAVAGKSPALAAIASSMGGAPNSGAPGPGAPGGGGAEPGAEAARDEPRSPEGAIMRDVHGFCSSIRPDQFQGMLQVLDPGQQRALYEMMQALQAHHEGQNQG